MESLFTFEEEEEEELDRAAPPKRCPECGGSNLIEDYTQGEVVCVSCGFVIYEKIRDPGPEWRAFDEDQRDTRARTGSPLSYSIHDKGLSTTIDWRDKDIYGKALGSIRQVGAYRLRKWQRRTRIVSSTERSLARALSEMSKLASILNLPKSVLEAASFIYRKAIKKKLARGRSVQGMAAASLYLACRKLKIARTLQEVTKATGLPRKKVTYSYRFLLRELGSLAHPPSPEYYASRIASQLKLIGATETIAHKILKAAKSAMLTSGRGPLGMATATLYMASIITGNKKTQRDLSNVTGITEVTLRNRYKELLDQLQITVKI